MSLSKPDGTKSRLFSLPKDFENLLNECLRPLGHSLSKPGELAKAVKQLSDYYIESLHRPTPWHQPWAQAAYLAYFFPLNYLRMAAVLQEVASTGFLQGLTRYIDFGCGLSALPFLTKDSPLKQGVGIDKSLEALHLLEELLKASGNRMLLYKDFNGVVDHKTDLGVFSYVVTETQKLPKWAPDLEALLIIEPSTKEDGRYLLDLREALIEENYFAWAPCTHNGECPLFNKSKKDWCHDRVSLDMPSWYSEIEKLLPMKNRTITYSYLAVRKTNPRTKSNLARSVGDVLDENGKYKQLICRGEDREFLAWLKKEHVEAPSLARGQLFEMPGNLEKVSDELRVPKDVKIFPAGGPVKGLV
jgi:hypothetical protein